MKYPFLIQDRVVFRTAAGAVSSYITEERFHGTIDLNMFLMFLEAETHSKCKYMNLYNGLTSLLNC